MPQQTRANTQKRQPTQQSKQRTSTKNRAQTNTQSKTATSGIPSQRRSGVSRGSGGRTKDQLYADARRAGVQGRSKMNKAQLESALKRS